MGFPRIEPLESRQLLSITWVNRGSDNFDVAYGSNADLARTLVDSAIANWSNVYGNRPKLKLRINAADLSSIGADCLGRTKGTSIKLDDAGATKGWYFDPDLNDDTESLKPIGGTSSGFIAQGNMGGKDDFYSTALHELGHALGFTDRHNPFRTTTARNHVKKDVHHTNDIYDLMYPTMAADTRMEISLNDAKKTRYKFRKFPRRFLCLSATTDQPDITLSWTGDEDVASYRIYRSTSFGGSRAASNPQLVHTDTQSNGSWTDIDVRSGLTYRYWISFDINTPYGSTMGLDSDTATNGLSTRTPDDSNNGGGQVDPGGDQPSVIKLYNTGVNANGVPLPDDTAGDSHYRLISFPDGGTSILHTRSTGYPVGLWLGADNLSTWIGPSNALNGPTGIYDYRTTFTVPVDCTIIISGKWAVDDFGANIRLNGTDTGKSIPILLAYTLFSDFTITGTAHAGTNTLDFLVTNGPGSTGLRVEFSSATYTAIT